MSAKHLVNPILWFLFFQSAGLLLLRKRLTRPWIFLVWFLLGLNGVFAVLSVPRMSRLLEQSLGILPMQKLCEPPRFIFVLGGGYLVGPTPAEDVLGIESQRRVLRGVSVWKKYPSAKLVFSGTSNIQNRRRLPERHAQLMADIAQQHGVPEEIIILEYRSTNTAEHAVEASKLLGVTSSTPIALVTNTWHMRRARHEFRRYFDKVMLVPVQSIPLRGDWTDWLPSADSLEDSTTFIREWIGLFWYTVKAHFRLAAQGQDGGVRC